MSDEIRNLLDQHDVTVSIDNQVFRSTECHKVGKGSEKCIYSLPNGNCFFIPSRIIDIDSWNTLIKREKLISDNFLSLGLNAQAFSIAQLTVKSNAKPHSEMRIPVLLTRNFVSLCDENSMLLLDTKSLKGTSIIGPLSYDFYTNRELFKNKDYVRTMFKTFLQEYVIALTFNLPISVLTNLDDCEHFCFELPKEAGDVPVFRYFFWDILGDYQKMEPSLIVPTVKQLRKPTQEQYSDNSLRDIVDNAGYFIYENHRAEFESKFGTGLLATRKVIDGIVNDIVPHIDDEIMLKEIVDSVKIIVYQRLVDIDSTLQLVDWLTAMKGCISIDDADLLKRYYKRNTFCLKADLHDSIKSLKHFASDYAISDGKQSSLCFDFLEHIESQLSASITAENQLNHNQSMLNSFETLHLAFLAIPKKSSRFSQFWSSANTKSKTPEDIGFRDTYEVIKKVLSTKKKSPYRKILTDKGFLDNRGQATAELRDLLAFVDEHFPQPGSAPAFQAKSLNKSQTPIRSA